MKKLLISLVIFSGCTKQSEIKPEPVKYVQFRVIAIEDNGNIISSEVKAVKNQ